MNDPASHQNLERLRTVRIRTLRGIFSSRAHRGARGELLKIPGAQLASGNGHARRVGERAAPTRPGGVVRGTCRSTRRAFRVLSGSTNSMRASRDHAGLSRSPSTPLDVVRPPTAIA